MIKYIPLVNMYRDQRLVFRPLDVRQVLCRLLDEMVEQVEKHGVRLAHDAFVVFRLLKSFGRISSP